MVAIVVRCETSGAEFVVDIGGGILDGCPTVLSGVEAAESGFANVSTYKADEYAVTVDSELSCVAYGVTS